MKKIIALALVFTLVLALTACAASPSENELEYNPFKGRIAGYAAGYGAEVLVDNVTGVCYLYRSTGYSGDLTVMLDADGNPLIYKEE